MSDQIKALEDRIEALETQNEILQESVEEALTLAKEATSKASSLNVRAKEKKTPPPPPGEFKNGNKNMKFKHSKFRGQVNGVSVFKNTADIVKDKELLEAILKEHPGVVEPAK